MKSKELSFFGYPPTLWFLFFVVAPLVIVFVISFLTRGLYGGIEWTFTFQNYLRAFNPVYLGILFKSFQLALMTALICLALAYPMAWTMATAAPRLRSLFFLLIAVPFMSNLIIRVYAIKLFVGADGPLQSTLSFWGFAYDSFALSQNHWLVMYGMVTTYLPFMVLPLYSAFEKLDFSLVESAQDLGANDWRVFSLILVPATRRAAFNGFILVFIPCMGEFVIPDLLGGAKNMLIGNLITEQFLKSRDWPFGSALSILLITILLAVPYFLRILFLKNRSGVRA